MKLIPAVVFFFLLSSFTFGQDLSRDQKIQQIKDMNAQIAVMEKDILKPSATDVREATAEGVEVFRLMPREIYDHKLTIQGGGSFYSFTTRSHDYQSISQIELEQDRFRSGFAGLDYGLLADLGTAPVSEIAKETPAVSFLLDYKPPRQYEEIRREQRRAGNYEVNGLLFKDYLPALVGHAYALRAISYEKADVLVAFKVVRKDTDGSMIIVWKLIETYDKPTYERPASDMRDEVGATY